MLIIDDLNIESEILNLFDFSLNEHSKNKIKEILNTPLKSSSECKNRQDMLRGFMDNQKYLSNYSYNALYLKEVYSFTHNTEIENFSQSKLKFKLLLSKKEKAHIISQITQMVLLFHRIESRYLSLIETRKFPEKFKSKINGISNVLSSLNLSFYGNLIQEGQLKDKNILQINSKIYRLQKNGKLKLFWDDLFEFEALLSISQGILKNNFSFPKFGSGNINLTELFHPLLESPVKNNFQTKSNVIVLNGPNMSGKSTFLKAIGLCIYLAHLGLAIPASHAELPFFESFSIALNRKDDLLNGYSHFITEINNLKNVVELANDGRKCFAIFDELFSGTNVEDAYEISQKTISGLSNYDNCFFIISTHIQALKGSSKDLVSSYFLDCEIKDGQPNFSYKLKEGWSDIKVGRILFDKIGLNEMLK